MTAYDPDDAYRRAFPPGPQDGPPPGPVPDAAPGLPPAPPSWADDGAARVDRQPGYGQPGYGQPGYGQAPTAGYPQPAAYPQPSAYPQPGGYPQPYAPVPYGSPPYPGYSPYGYGVAPKSPALALLASFFIPGLGSMLNGEVGKGIGILVGYLVSAVLTIVIVGFVGLAIFWIWGMVDGYQGARAWNARHGIVS